MGEISEACQVIILCGRFAVALKDITVASAVLSAQVMSTIYNAKWKGSTSYKRLLNVKGEENGLVFVNIGIEEDSRLNKERMKGIKKELKDHGILFAELPDLCGGDGNTQICVSARDAVKLSAMLLSHANGKYKDVPVAEISQFDYTSTAYRADGSPTPEFDQFFYNMEPGQYSWQMAEQAVTEVNKTPVRSRISAGTITVKKETKTLTGVDKEKIRVSLKASRQTETGRGADALSYDWFPDFLKNGEEGKEKVFDGPADGFKRNPVRRIRPLKRRSTLTDIGGSISDKVVSLADAVWERTKGRQKRQPGYADGVPDPCPNLPKKVVAQIIREHEYDAFGGRDSYLWLDETPVLSKEIKGEKYHLFSLPEGDKGIIIPDSAYREYDFDDKSGYYFGKRGALVCEARDYYTVDYKTGDINVLPGDEVIKAAKKTPVESYAEKLEQMMLDAKQKALLGDTVKNVVSRKL